MPTDLTQTFALHPGPVIPPGGRTYTDEIFTSSTITNVEYAPGLFADIYQPVGDTLTTRAFITTCHAGGGDYATFQYWAKYFIKFGYVVASVQYGETVPYTAERQRKNVTNVGAFERYMRLNATTYGIDPTKFLGMGVSAGALTILSYAIAANDLGDPYFDTPNNDLYPGEANGILASATLPGNCTPLFASYLQAGDPPNYFYHGTADALFPIAQVEERLAEMVDLGIASTLLEFPGAPHKVNHDAEIKADLVPKFAALVA